MADDANRRAKHHRGRKAGALQRAAAQCDRSAVHPYVAQIQSCKLIRESGDRTKNTGQIQRQIAPGNDAQVHLQGIDVEPRKRTCWLAHQSHATALGRAGRDAVEGGGECQIHLHRLFGDLVQHPRLQHCTYAVRQDR